MSESESNDVPEYSDQHILDDLCYHVVQGADRWYPPKETARECAEAVADEDDDEDEIYEKELMYHAGALNMLEGAADLLAQYDDVVARAERHAERSELDLPTDWDITEHWAEATHFSYDGEDG